MSAVHRYYDPTTGEFLTVDPEVASTGQPYFYANDDPVNATDPTGMCSDFNISCWSSNNSWMMEADSSPNGQASVDWTQAFYYLVDNGFSAEESMKYTDSFNWNRPVSMVHMPAGADTIKYANSGTNAGRRIFTTSNVYDDPAGAVSALHLKQYGNHATYAWMIQQNFEDPVLYGYVNNGTGTQFLNAAADTDTMQTKSLLTRNIGLFFSVFGYHIQGGWGAPSDSPSASSAAQRDGNATFVAQDSSFGGKGSTLGTCLNT